MPLSTDLSRFLASVHPYDRLTEDALAALAAACSHQTIAAGETLFSVGDPLDVLYIIVTGEMEMLDDADVQIALLGPRNSFGERSLFKQDVTRRTAVATADTTLILVPGQTFFALVETYPPVARFFDRRRKAQDTDKDLATLPVERLMTRAPLSVGPETPIRDAAALMHQRHISSTCISDAGGFQGIVTLRDLNSRVIVEGADTRLPIRSIMTSEPLTLAPDALVTDVLHVMVERGIGHVPILKGQELVGIVTQTDLTRAQATTSADLIGRIARATSPQDMARVTEEIPHLLAQLVEAANRHAVVTRLITDIADTTTRRMLALGEAQLGPPPVPYLWLACGSQGRQEQTGVSDQDNCLFLSDETRAADMPYFSALARFVCDGLNTCGYVYCPGDMMATNPRWCQPLKAWRQRFYKWIATPNPEAQMLASVMFDLRPIGGEDSLFRGLQADVLNAAAKNSIFMAHMGSNALKHHPPLGLLRGLATIRSGDHRNTLDLKHNGVVPIVDLARIYALTGQLAPANTRARLGAAIEAGIVSSSGGADLIDAYDLIAETRLEHQMRQVRAGQHPTNFLDPSILSDFERAHLRDAFVVVKTMQSSVGSGKGMLG